MGYTIIAQSLETSLNEIEEARRSGDWKTLPLAGYLSNLSPKVFEESFRHILPGKIKGIDFINQHQNTIDRVTEIKKESTYSVLACAAHPIYENERVKKFRRLLAEMNEYAFQETQIQSLGQLMFESHQAYTHCGLGSSRTDEIVELARKAKGIHGAKITGGGSGGTVCLLAVGDVGLESAKKIHREMEERHSTRLEIFGISSRSPDTGNR